MEPLASPFFLKGESTAALLFIHGFTASPSEVLPTASLINAMGNISVKGLLLPGHGSTPQDLNRTGWQDWSAAVSRECRTLLRDYRLYVAGLSMGGMLALYAGLNIPEISGLISINAPLYVKNSWGIKLAPLLSCYRPFWNKEEIDLQLKEKGRFAYDCYPLKALNSMQQLRKILMKSLPNLKTSVLILQSLRDESVMPRSADFIVNSCPLAAVRKVELPNSEHVATMGAEKETIAKEIVSFIN